MREMGFALPTGYWGVDIFLGEPDHLDRGIGSRAVSLIYRYLIEERSAIGVGLVVARDNLRAQRAYEKAGLVRVSEVLDTDTREGRRIPSYLMASPPPSWSPHPNPPPLAGGGESSPPAREGKFPESAGGEKSPPP